MRNGPRQLCSADSRTLGFRADTTMPRTPSWSTRSDVRQLHRRYRRSSRGAATAGPDGSPYLTGSTTSPSLFGRTKPSIGETSSSSSSAGGTAVDFVTTWRRER